MKYLVGLVFSLFSSSAFAGVWHIDSVNSIYPLANGDFVVTFKNPPDSCINESKYFYVKVGSNSMTQEGSEKIYSLAMTAATTGKKLKVYFDETSSLCHVNRAQVSF